MTDIPTLAPIAGPSAESAASLARIREEALAEVRARLLRERGPQASGLTTPVRHDAEEERNVDRVRAAARAWLEAVLGDHGDVDATGAVDWSESVTEGYAECAAIVRVRVRV